MVVEAAVGRRELSEKDLARIAEHVSRVGFDPDHGIRAEAGASGVVWEGRWVGEDDALSSADYHYIRHPYKGQEWPEGTTQSEYQASIAALITDPDTGILASRFRGRWTLSFVRKSRELEGRFGHEWTLVEYNPATDHWATAFQPARGLAYLDEEHEDRVWLRKHEDG